MNTLTASEAKALGKVGVLFGGRSAERDVSIMSGTGVLEALRGLGIDAHPFDPGRQSLGELAAQGFDRVFIALHGRYGEDGSLQGALEQMGVPYTGSGVMSCAIAMDKIYTKMIWLMHGLPTPRYVQVPRGADIGAAAALGFPVMVKPPHEGSTIGITRVDSQDGLQAAFDTAYRYDEVVLAEEFVAGREFTVAMLGKGDSARALPVVEIVAPGGNYDYQNKYFTDDTQYFCPAQLDPTITAEMQQIAVAAYRALDCEGWGRIDFMLRASDNKPFLIEANLSPGMTGHSLVPMAARATGMSYETLCVEILRAANLKMKA